MPDNIDELLLEIFVLLFLLAKIVLFLIFISIKLLTLE
jgi:hypothetical protein